MPETEDQGCERPENGAVDTTCGPPREAAIHSRRRNGRLSRVGGPSRPSSTVGTSRFLVVTGPCSIHDETAALEYAERVGRGRQALRRQAARRYARLL